MKKKLININEIALNTPLYLGKRETVCQGI